jgi:hypothetical protein
MFADGRLTGVEQFGSFGEAFVLVDRNEYFQMSCFDDLVLWLYRPVNRSLRFGWMPVLQFVLWEIFIKRP